MRRLFKLTMRLFIRGRQTAIGYALLLMALIGFFWYTYRVYFIPMPLPAIKDLLAKQTAMLFVGVIAYAAFMYIGYELFLKTKQSGMDEFLAGQRNGLLKAYGAMTSVLALFAGLFCALSFAFDLLMYFVSGAGYPRYLLHMLPVHLLYFFLVPMAGGMIGAALAAWLDKRRVLCYCVMVFLLMLATTYSDPLLMLAWQLSGSGAEVFTAAPIVDALFGVRDYFLFVPIDVKAYGLIIDYQYGIPIEPPRWFLLGFWLLFPGTLIFIKASSGVRLRRTIATALCGLALFSLAGFVFKSPLPLADDRPGGIMHHDPIYYMSHTGQTGSRILPVQDPGFTIESCEMDLYIGNRFRAVASLKLSELAPHQELYHLTLYHGYDVQSIHAADGNPVEFTREGDRISVGREQAGDARTITIRYGGNGRRYYANPQGIRLPGYFAYYPVVGDIGFEYMNNNAKPNKWIGENMVDFTVRVHTRQKVLSNLPGEENVFSGRSRSVTLLAGFIECLDEDLRVWGPPLNPNEPDYSAYEEGEKLISDISRGLGGKVSMPDMSGMKTFLVTPQIASFASMAEIFVMLDDHMFGGGLHSLYVSEAVMDGVLPSRANSDLLKSMLLSRAMNPDLFARNHAQYSKPSPREFIEAIEELLVRETKDEVWLVSFRGETGGAFLFLERFSHRREEFLQRVFEYVQRDEETDSVDFLIELLEEDARLREGL